MNLISNVKLLLYAGCALVFLGAMRYWWIARRERQRTIYGLEKEVAGERSLRALTFAVLSLGFGGLVYLADTNTPAALVSPQRSPTLNVALFITPTATVPPPTATAAPPTPTPLRGAGGPVPATATPHIVVTSPPLPPTPRPQPPVCPDPSVRITSPGIDAHLSGIVSIAGTAAIPNFQYYKVEYGVGDPPQSWHVLGDVRRRQVSDGVLETFNSASLPSGVYYLRLTVVDQTGNFPIAPCIVRVVLGS